MICENKWMNSSFPALPPFEHIDVRETETVAYWLDKYGDRAKILAGATDLLSLMKDRVELVYVAGNEHWRAPELK